MNDIEMIVSAISQLGEAGLTAFIAWCAMKLGIVIVSWAGGLGIAAFVTRAVYRIVFGTHSATVQLQKMGWEYHSRYDSIGYWTEPEKKRS